MLWLKIHRNSLLKNALAALGNIMFTKASIFYGQHGLSLYVSEMPLEQPIAILDLFPKSFEIFDCGKHGYIDIDLTTFCELLNLATDNEAITITFGDIRKIKTFRGDKTIKFQFRDLGCSCLATLLVPRFKIVNGILCLAAENIWEKKYISKCLICSMYRLLFCFLKNFAEAILCHKLLNLVLDGQGFNVVNSMSGSKLTVFYEMEISRSDRDSVEWQNYDVAFGIPSQVFKRVFSELPIPGETQRGIGEDSLYMYMSIEQLRFSSKAREIILSKELGQCEIWGAEIEQTIEEACSLEFASSYLKAVHMAEMVWCLIYHHKECILLSCQIGQLSNVYFPLYPGKYHVWPEPEA